jgi:hypothetical protein
VIAAVSYGRVSNRLVIVSWVIPGAAFAAGVVGDDDAVRWYVLGVGCLTRLPCRS